MFMQHIVLVKADWMVLKIQNLVLTKWMFEMKMKFQT